jgi:NAD(P)-dependent dehydrogenase (short-subunit alcohol dehydrogenase family)
MAVVNPSPGVPVALITGASRGFGLEVARALAARGWRLIVDARDGQALRQAMDRLEAVTDVTALPGDVTDRQHQEALRAAVAGYGRLDLLVNNASTLGPSPLPALRRAPLSELPATFAVNTVAPIALAQLLMPQLIATGGTVINVTSDAAVEAYPGWGMYGASKAALDQLSAILAAEEPQLRVYAFDPGDMRTQMHQDAFPGEDISDRPEPATAVPALLRLVDERPPSDRYRAADLGATDDAVAALPIGLPV